MGSRLAESDQGSFYPTVEVVASRISPDFAVISASLSTWSAFQEKFVTILIAT